MTEIIFEVSQDELDGDCSASAFRHGIHAQGNSVEEIRSTVHENIDRYFGDAMPQLKLTRLHFVSDASLDDRSRSAQPPDAG